MPPLFVLLVLALMSGGCAPPAPDTEPTTPSSVSFTQTAADLMSTRVVVQLPEGQEASAARVVEIFREVEALANEWRPSSPVGRINAAAGGTSVRVPVELADLVVRGVELGEQTNGAFDITWAALWGLWDFQAPVPERPDPAEVAARLSLIDYRAVGIEADSISLSRTGMVMGLGGIAKGHALDRAADALRRSGVSDFVISAGGQVYAGGRHGDRPWRVGIRDPRGTPDDFFALVEVQNASVSTSGDYERFFVLDGVRYHHVLDPRTGQPARGVRSATVVSSDATLADALSTAIMVLGVEEGMALLTTLEGVEGVVVDAAGDVHVSTGLAGQLVRVHPPKRAAEPQTHDRRDER